MYEKVDDKSVWLGANIQDSPQWIHKFSSEEVKELGRALETYESRCNELHEMNKSNFPLSKVAAAIDQMLNEIEEGLGLYLFRGLNTQIFTKDQLRAIFWGIGLYCGTAVSQSKKGDVLGDVRNIGTPHDGPNFRGYTSNGELTYHCDAADVTALFCLHPAKNGGLSRIVSLSSVHNQIKEERPDLLEVLYNPYYWGRQGNEMPNQSPYYTQPIFSNWNKNFAGRYTRTHIKTAELGNVTPKLTPTQEEALNLIDSICKREEFQLTMMFEPGDIQFLNNFVTLHTRTEFEDYADPMMKRHLLRLWFSPKNNRELSPGFRPFFREIKSGSVRGGFPGHGEQKVFQTTDD